MRKLAILVQRGNRESTLASEALIDFKSTKRVPRGTINRRRYCDGWIYVCIVALLDRRARSSRSLIEADSA